MVIGNMLWDCRELCGGLPASDTITNSNLILMLGSTRTHVSSVGNKGPPGPDFMTTA